MMTVKELKAKIADLEASGQITDASHVRMATSDHFDYGGWHGPLGVVTANGGELCLFDEED